jgi:ribosomal-protein-alanine N-acetyltransferase
MIRRWEEKDVAKIAEMEQRCFKDAWSEAMLRESFSNPLTHCFLVEEGGQVCGYCCLFVLFEDAEVLNIAVDESHRGKGYAKQMMGQMHACAKTLGAERCLLEVRVSNAPAIALYKGFGYQSYGVREKYYADGESAYVMQTAL